LIVSFRLRFEPTEGLGIKSKNEGFFHNFKYDIMISYLRKRHHPFRRRKAPGRKQLSSQGDGASTPRASYGRLLGTYGPNAP
jgi:hypothetical protein